MQRTIRSKPKILQRVGIILIFTSMKTYKKVKMQAKNAPSGSYAAGCPADRASGSDYGCKSCDRAA